MLSHFVAAIKPKNAPPPGRGYDARIPPYCPFTINPIIKVSLYNNSAYFCIDLSTTLPYSIRSIRSDPIGSGNLATEKAKVP